MLKRRILILLLFVLIGSAAVVKTVHQCQMEWDNQSGESAGYHGMRQRRVSKLPEMEDIRKLCRLLLDRLLLLSVTVPFLMTMVLLSYHGTD